jgi:hypothetical protein
MTTNRRTTALGLGLALFGGVGARSAEAGPTAMVLANDTSWFQLTIVDYQFPHLTDDHWDANWLMISGSVQLSGKAWNFKDPCLTTFEALGLADWLEACAHGAPEKPYCSFTEPVLQFDLPDAGTLRVSFALEASPPWGKQGDDWDKHGFNLPVGPQLLTAAADLRRQLERFPVRGPKDDA